MLYAIVAVLVILADQMIKLYVSAEGFQPMNLIPGVLNLTKVENTGGAFGLFGGEIPTIWFIIIAGVFTVLVILALSTKFINGFLARWSIVLVTAGGVSNCIDRVINVRPTGHVVDMFQFDFWKSFPVFNLADVFISVFCVVFILAILFGRNPKDEDEEEDEFSEDEDEAELVEEEEEKPRRRGRKARKADYDEEPDETLDEEEYRRPAKSGRKARKARQSRYEEEYEQYKAAQAAQRAREAAQQPQPAAVVENPSYDPADPFAEWERVSAAQPTAQQPAPGAEPAPAPVRPRASASHSALAADPQYASRPAESAQPVQSAPAPKPATRPAPKPVEENTSFSLDDILAEFK